MSGSAPPPASEDARAKTADPSWIGHIKWLIATLAIPFALAWIAHEFSDRQADRDAQDRKAAGLRSERESRLKTYSELLNKREEADMNVRKEIFSTLLGNYFDRSTGDKAKEAAKGGATGGELTRRMTVLELLASNFDESLNLSPLFWQLDRELGPASSAERQDIRERLSRLAQDVKRRQVDALAASGGMSEQVVFFGDSNAIGQPLFNKEIVLANTVLGHATGARGCRFEVMLLEFEPDKHRVYATVKSDTRSNAATVDDSCVTSSTHEPKQWSFWVDEFDFPLINYVRLSTTERFSVVMSSYNAKEASATISLVYFPSSRSGARDRPFLDTVVDSFNVLADPQAAPLPASAAASR